MSVSIQQREEARKLIIRLLGLVPQYMDCRPSCEIEGGVIVDTQFNIVEGKRRLRVDLRCETVEVMEG